MKKLITLSTLLTFTVFIIAQTSTTLTVNNVHTKVQNTLSPFYNPSTQKSNYNIINNGDSIRPIYNTGLWLSGIDLNDSLYTSIHRNYDDKHFTFGPITNDTSNSYELQYNKLWKVTQQDIYLHTQNISTTNAIENWPAHGDTANGESFYLAPFVDINSDGRYNSNDGDYPKIKGDEAVYYILNDKNSVRNPFLNYVPLEVEIHVMIYAFNSSISSVNNTTFINYSIYNRSNVDYYDLNIGAFMDADIECAGNDFVASDSTRNIILTFDDEDTIYYNGINCDSTQKNTTQSSIGIKFLNRTLHKKTYFTSYFSSWSISMYRYLTTPFNNQSNFIYPNGEQDLEFYSPIQHPDDFRMLGTTSLNSFPSNSSICLDLAYISYRNNSLNNVNKAINLLKSSDTIQDFYNSVNLDCIGYITNQEQQEINSIFTSKVSPNPASDFTTIEFSSLLKQGVIKLYNSIGQEVLSSPILQSNNYNLEQGFLDNGIYFYQVIENNSLISTGKVIFK